MEDKRNKLDQIIRAKMAGMDPAYRPETWEQLSYRLDELDAEATAGLTVGALMEDSPLLDEVIRDKMESLTPEYSPQSWEQMSERLDQLEEGAPAEVGPEALDEVIFNRMHRLQTPYQPSHWDMMLQRLQAETALIHRLLRYKAMELSLLALLLLTFVRLPFPNQNPIRPDALPVPTIPRAQANKATEQTDPATDRSIDAQKGETEVLADIATRQPESQGVRSLDASDVPADAASIFGPDNAALDIWTPENSPAAVPEFSRLQRSIPSPKAPNKEYTLPKSPVAQAKPQDNKVNPTFNLGQPNALGVLSYLPAGMIKPLCQTCFLGLDQKVKKLHQTVFFRIGMQGGPEYNRIITPPTLINGESYEDDRYALGYSGALTFGMEIGRWEIETGLVYSNKRYFALPVVVLQGSVSGGFFGDGTKQFDLDVFQVPLNLRYDVYRKNRWRVYGLAGVSLQITGQSNYYLANPDGFQTNNYHPLPIRPGTDNQGRYAASVKSQFDNFTKGWLEGGGFRENSFLNANLGVGVERFITDYWSIYAQPTYRHSLYYLNGGLGPFYDRVHTNSLLIGVKVRLK